MTKVSRNLLLGKVIRQFSQSLMQKRIDLTMPGFGISMHIGQFAQNVALKPYIDHIAEICLKHYERKYQENALTDVISAILEGG